MAIPTAEILSLLSLLCEEKNFRVAVQESAKGGAIAGVSTLIGGLLGGPIGLAVGGTVGGLTAAYFSQGKFKSVASIIKEDLTIEQKEELASPVRRILSKWGLVDVAAITMFAIAPEARENILQEVVSYFKTQLKLPIID